MKLPQVNFPTTIVIFGVTGDLGRKKLIPALFDLYAKEYLPTTFRIVGFARKEYSHEVFRAFVRDVIRERGHHHPDEMINDFLENVFYQQGLFDDIHTYTVLSEFLGQLDLSVGQCTNKLFYLAVPPASYQTIFQNLAQSGLTIPCSDAVGWTRVLVEKPFGKDLQTAQELDMLLGELFQEKQIFRIDHYLAKETVQNILTFRFSNNIFDPVWNREWIEKVEIKLLENIDVQTRGAFYDDVGALRDVGQNHILQMLALIAMEHPENLQADHIRAGRAKVFQSLRLADDDIEKGVVRGQYEGYASVEGVRPDSTTETYFKLKTFIENDRWRGVPFYLESGKALGERKVEIVVHFKKIDPCFCPQPHGLHKHSNMVTFSIQPEEKITVRFWAKRPGITSEIIPRDLSFDYAGDADGKESLPDAYEKVLFDCIAGDQTLFTSTDEVRASWEFITPILERWDATKLEVYTKGSAGPEREL
jgi:glucose-6-phosphate 1-dehydrogenase